MRSLPMSEPGPLTAAGGIALYKLGAFGLPVAAEQFRTADRAQHAADDRADRRADGAEVCAYRRTGLRACIATGRPRRSALKAGVGQGYE